MDNNKLIIALVAILIVMLVAGIFILNPGHAKADSRVIVTSNSTLHDGDSFTIRLTDLNDTPIANQTVNITIVDPNGDENHQVVTTDANGEASLPLRLATTNYTVNVSFAGNDNFTPCNTTQKLEMKEKIAQSQSTSNSSSSNSNSYNNNDGYWETSPDANFEYHTEHYSDGNLRQYDRSGRLVGSTYEEDQYEVGMNVGFKY